MKQGKLIKLGDFSSIISWELIQTEASAYPRLHKLNILHVEDSDAVRSTYWIESKKERDAVIKALSRTIDTYKDMLNKVQSLDFD